MNDRDIAAALAAGDPEGLAAAYDQHAARLYGYCRGLLGEAADAADAVQDTFIIAAAQAGGLRSPARLRPWLYAIARNEAHSRLRAGAWPARADGDSDPAAGPEAVGGAADGGQGELRYLVLEALSRLSPAEREIAELSRWHGLKEADLAGVLGLPVSQAGALAVRSGAELDRSLGTLLVAADTAWGECARLDALLDGWDGRPTMVWRTRAGRHIDGCPVCGERRRKMLSQATLLRLAPLPPLPDSLREQVLWLIPDDSPEAASYRDEVIGRSGPFDPAGFPVQIAPAGWAGRSGRAGRARGLARPARGRRRGGDRPLPRQLALLAALLVLIGGGGIAALVRHGGGAGRSTADPAGTPASLSVPGIPGGSAQPGLPGPDPARPSSAPAGSGSPSPGSSAPAGPSSRPPTPSPVVSSAPPRVPPKPKPKPPPPPPVLSESPGTVSMVPGNAGWSGSFTLSAANGPIAFTVSAPSGLSVSESAGTVRPGSPVTIRVTYMLELLPTFPSPVTVNGITVGLSYQK
jgi:RNA polymerase sigma factor (sigma-70 family)